MTLNSQRSLEKEEWSWWSQSSWLQIILQSYSHQDRMILAQKQKYRPMEQDRKPRNKPMYLWVPYFWQRRLLLSHFSRVRLCATPQTAAQQAPPSLGLSRQEHWSGLPFPSPMRESEKWKWSHQSCPTFSDPMDCSLPVSSLHGILQARVLEWGAIAFSGQRRQEYTMGQRHPLQ